MSKPTNETANDIANEMQRCCFGATNEANRPNAKKLEQNKISTINVVLERWDANLIG